MALPSGYEQFEYIQSSGTQLIDTGFTPTANTRVVMDFQLTTAGTGNRCLFGVVGQFSFRWYGSSSVFRSNGSGSANFPTGISGTERHTVDKTATTCTLDGEYTVTTTAGTVSNSLYLFAQNSGSGSYTNPASAKLYSCQIYENDVLVRDFVPCKNASGTVGLYDVVNSKFYGSSGTGTLEGFGAVIEPDSAYEIITASGFHIERTTRVSDGTAVLELEISNEITLDGKNLSLVNPTTLTIRSTSASEIQSKLPPAGTYIYFSFGDIQTKGFYQITESTYVEVTTKYAQIANDSGTELVYAVIVHELDKLIVVPNTITHKALVESTCYDIGWGKTLIDGTEYDICGGKALINGIVYNIPFNTNFTVQIIKPGNGMYGYMTINGVKYTSVQTIECESGTTLSFYASANSLNSYADYVKIRLNGTVVAQATKGSGNAFNGTPSSPATFDFVPKDRDIVSVSMYAVNQTQGTMYQIDIVTS